MRDNSRTNGAAFTWGCFVASVILLLYHEKVFFDDYFKTGTDYGLVLGLTSASFFLIAIFSAKFPVKIINGLLWGVLLTMAVLWVRLGAALPMAPSDIGCVDPICQLPGQLALITLQLGIAPPLLLEFFRRSQRSLSQSTGFSTGMWAGIGLLAAGLISLAGYYWTYIVNVGLSILTAIGVLSMSLRNVPAPLKVEKNEAVSLYLGRFLRDLAMLAYVGVFGFSIMEHDVYSFGLLIPFGIGFFTFAVVFHYAARLSGESHATTLLEGVVVGAMVLILGFMIYTIFSNEAVVLPVILPPWMVGFAGAYLWHRIEILASGIRMHTGDRERHFLKFPLHLIRKIIFMLYVTVLFLLMAINIDAKGTDSALILDIGFVIGVGYLLALILHSQKKSPGLNPIASTYVKKSGL